MLTYKDSGVNIQKANILTNIIKETVRNNNIGMFAGLFEHPVLNDYYIAAATDGIGSKIIPLIDNNMPECISKDLIAMCLNDLICTGAAPLFFLDYIATNKLEVEFISKVISYLNKNLAEYNCILLGGETSELKDLISERYFDIAGFAIGLVNKKSVLRKENVKENDIIIGLASNGIHSNGFTLIRKLYKQELITKEELISTLKPTDIYVKEIIELDNKNLIHACANITGGGIIDNMKRIIPDNLCALLNQKSIPEQEIFNKIEKIIGYDEAYKTFNMGCGFCIIAPSENKDKIKKICKKFNPFEFGVVVKNDQNCNICFR